MNPVEIADLGSAWQVEYNISEQIIQPRYLLSQTGAEDQVKDQAQINLADYLGCGISFTWRGLQPCSHCGESVVRHYGGSYCYDCFASLARCDLCVVSPDRCHYHAGTCREPEWGDSFCMQPHVVYVAATSDLKVGITRLDRVWRRWIDQGAKRAMILATAPTRRCAGMLEAYCAQVTQDRTDWRRLVRGETAQATLQDLRRALQHRLGSFAELADAGFAAQPDPEELAAMRWEAEPEEYVIEQVVQQYSPAQRFQVGAQAIEVTDVLQGVVGHYLLCNSGVFDLQAHSHAVVECRLNPEISPNVVSDGSPQASLF